MSRVEFIRTDTFLTIIDALSYELLLVKEEIKKLKDGHNVSQPKEIRVYVIDQKMTDFDFDANYSNGDYEAIMSKAEELGSVYTLEGLESVVNAGGFSVEDCNIYISNNGGSK